MPSPLSLIKKMYSPLERAVVAHKLESMPSSQWAAYIKANAPKAAKKEALAVKLDELLARQPKLSKADIVKHIQENSPKVNTKNIRAEGYGSDETQYAKYVLPGGEDYTETLIHLPPNTSSPRIRMDKAFEIKDANGTVLASGTMPIPARTLEKINNNPDWVVREYDQPNLSDVLRDPSNFSSGHFDEPNILAHLRTNIKLTPDNKDVLFLEELQSDWAQQGRKKGFGSGVTIKPDANGFFRAYDNNGNTIELRVGGERFSALNSEEAVRAALPTSYVPKGIPHGPYVEDTGDWTALGLKKAIERAVDEGQSHLAWTTGAQQADRYNLAKQIDELMVTKNPDNTVSMLATLPGGGEHSIGKNIPMSSVSDYIGSDLAKQIEAQSIGGEVYNADALRVGGEGMKTYYDQIIPSTANDILKSMGVTERVKPIGVQLGNNVSEQMGFEITPEIRDYVMNQGLPAFAGGGVVKAAAKGLREMAEQYITPKAAPAVSRIEMNFKDVTKRTKDLQDAAIKLDKGELSASEYDKLVNSLKPVTPYSFVPSPATYDDAMRALNKNQKLMYGKTSEIPIGEQTDLRLDIPAYTKHGVWVNSIHRNNAPTVYDSVSSVKNATMIGSPDKALKVAKGGPKAPFAVIRGEWNPISQEDAVKQAQENLASGEWIQVGYDPERHGYFYDRSTMEPVAGAEEVLQIGPLVIAKNPAYAVKSEQKFGAGGAVKAAAKGLRGLAEQYRLAKDAFLKDSQVKHVVYRGDITPIDEFKGPAFFGSKDVANQFADPEYMFGSHILAEGEHPVVTPAYVSIKKPKIFTTDQQYEDYVMDGGKHSNIDWAAKGYDGIIYAPEGNIHAEDAYYKTFKPNQIKSAIGNKGTFDPNEADVLKAEGGVVNMAGGGIVRSGIKDLMDLVAKYNGRYGAQRVERAADEVPNLEQQYTKNALKNAFTGKGDTAQALTIMRPSEFEEWAQPLSKSFSSNKNYSPDLESFMSHDEYIDYLAKIATDSGFSDVPYLQMRKDEVGIPLKPYMTGHEGRHRTRALNKLGDQATLIEVLPYGDLRSGLPRQSQEEYIEALKKELEMQPLVRPEPIYRSLHEGDPREPMIFPKVFKEGGPVHMDEGGLWEGYGAPMTRRGEGMNYYNPQQGQAVRVMPSGVYRERAAGDVDINNYTLGTDVDILNKYGFGVTKQGEVVKIPERTYTWSDDEYDYSGTDPARKIKRADISELRARYTTDDGIQYGVGRQPLAKGWSGYRADPRNQSSVGVTMSPYYKGVNYTKNFAEGGKVSDPFANLSMMDKAKLLAKAAKYRVQYNKQAVDHGKYPDALSSELKKNYLDTVGNSRVNRSPLDVALNYGGGYDFGVRQDIPADVARDMGKAYQYTDYFFSPFTGPKSDAVGDYYENMAGVEAGIKERGRRATEAEIQRRSAEYGRGVSKMLPQYEEPNYAEGGAVETDDIDYDSMYEFKKDEPAFAEGGEVDYDAMYEFKDNAPGFAKGGPVLSVGRGEKLPVSQGAGLTAKGRAKYNAATGSKLKAPAPHPKTDADAGRRKSFCARMSGMPGPMKDENGNPTRKAASLKRWNC